MSKIKEKVKQIVKEKEKFLNRQRIQEGKLYIPQILIKWSGIKEIVAVNEDIKPATGFKVPFKKN